MRELWAPNIVGPLGNWITWHKNLPKFWFLNEPASYVCLIYVAIWYYRSGSLLKILIYVPDRSHCLWVPRSMESNQNFVSLCRMKWNKRHHLEPTCVIYLIVHLQPAFCTMVQKEDLILWEVGVTSNIFYTTLGTYFQLLKVIISFWDL